MSLIRRKMTPKLLAANRANAQKSTGPRTEQGITNTSQNIVKPLPFPSTITANMRELGEDPEEYKSLSEALRRTLDPQDEFEQMLVEDMAQARWRRQRLIRAESGLAASQRRKLEIERELNKHARGSAYERMAKLQPVAQFGYAGMHDSVEKCEHMLELLGLIREGVVVGDLREKNTDVFDLAYGKCPDPARVNLQSSFQRYRKNAQSARPEDAAVLQRQFLAKVDAEIAAYEKLKELLTARDVETTPAMKDAQLLPGADQLEAIGRYDAGLERQFESKLKLLVAWRSAKRGFAPDGGTMDERDLPPKR